MHDPRVLVIGAGVSGASLARVLAEAGIGVVVAEARPHTGGHCHTYRHSRTGIMVHAHGPHIFHSDDPVVWSFVERFAAFIPYVHLAMGISGGRAYPLPVNLDTISQFFARDFSEEAARAFITARARHYDHPPANFAEQGRSVLGDALYEAFFDGYTRKQWGMDPERLPASVFSRLPVRFDRDRNYFHHSRVAIPDGGYTAMTDAMLAHPNIALQLGRAMTARDAAGYRHCIYTGPLDSWFGHRLGRLHYRTLDFETIEEPGTRQPVATVNYCDMSVPWTRITEHKHFAPHERHADTVCFVERSRDCAVQDTPYYPVRLAADERLFEAYRTQAMGESGVSFVGRLATYRYIDMDVAIGEAIVAAQELIRCLRGGHAPAPFFDRPPPVNPASGPASASADR